MYGIRIAGIGVALPDRVVTNDDIAKLYLEERDAVLAAGVELTPEQRKAYETSHDWILERTGITERRIAEPHETTSDYAARAGHAAWIDAYGDGLEMPEFIVLGTVSPDYPQTPPTSVVTMRKMHFPSYRRGENRLHLRNCATMDVSLACTTPIAALGVGCAFIQSGMYERGLVIVADCMSRTVGRHHRQRSPFAILADAGAAYALEAGEVSASSFCFPRPIFLGGDGGKVKEGDSMADLVHQNFRGSGKHENLIKTIAGGAAVPVTAEALDPRNDWHKMYMGGRELYKVIVPLLADQLVPDALEFLGLRIEDINVFIPHQANLRMSQASVERLAVLYPHVAFRMANRDNPAGVLVGSSATPKIHTVIWYDTIDHFGNTTSPAMALSTYEARELGIITPKTRVLQLAFGGGLSWGATAFTLPK